MNDQPGTGAPKEQLPSIRRPARVFVSYAKKDAKLRAELEKHLASLQNSGHVLVWHDRMIRPGDDRAGTIDAELETADIVLLLVSANFFASSSCFDIELTKALDRHRCGQTRVIPVLVRDCDWTAAPFGHLEAVPYQPGAGVKPVTAWSDRDAAWASVARELRSLVESGPDAPGVLRSQSESASKAPTKPRSHAAAGVLFAGVVAVGIAIGVIVQGKKEGPSPSASGSSPVDPMPPSSAASRLPGATASASASAVPILPSVNAVKQPQVTPWSSAPTVPVAGTTAADAGLTAAADARLTAGADAELAPKRGTATLSGAFWSLGVRRSELGGAAFVCLDPEPRPAEVAGVQPICSVLAGSDMAQCSRSDKAREISIGTSVAWRLPCP
ncbi:toll/interleukin-1 receptor domain-containing protein [Sorangium sp. So ce394]|uniref:toll/interleukin-1 receptor domain-containing protein n=1 Tax=Sorangium sp. So ce394 TaxID=3133310 RepID=UPI003F5BF415